MIHSILIIQIEFDMRRVRCDSIFRTRMLFTFQWSCRYGFDHVIVVLDRGGDRATGSCLQTHTMQSRTTSSDATYCGRS